MRADQANIQLKIGTTGLRLVTLEQLKAFQPGIEYRVFYLAGSVPTIPSAEVVGSEGGLEEIGSSVPDVPVEKDVVVQMQSHARPILYVLAVLVLGIPLLGFAIGGLPAMLRGIVWGGILCVAVGFVFWALRRVSS